MLLQKSRQLDHQLVHGRPTQTAWTEEQQTSWETAWRAWRDLAGDVQVAVTDHTKAQGTPRHQVEADANRKLEAELAELRPLKKKARALEADLAAARTSLRQMIRDTNQGGKA
ncbi:hypothetical protein ABZ016_13175 [Streptomyces sp. NPDC006372]|uniref:hypothetical protein n=1 Tax=Streptomyces sp. NPDC006372 TaxID=3155599 RepID=UPI0033AE6FCA